MRTFVLTMITRKICIPVFLAGGVVLAGVFVINPTLMVLLMFVTDVATMAVATDRVIPSPLPDRWSVPSPVTTALGLGTLLLAIGWGLLSLTAEPAPPEETGKRKDYLCAVAPV